MELIAGLKHYLNQDSNKNLEIITSKYKWEVIDSDKISSRFLKFAAKKKESEKRYYCLILDEFEEKRYLDSLNECQKYDSLVSFDDTIKIVNITCLFYEVGEPLNNSIQETHFLNNIDEKKLLKMLNEINLASSMDLPESKITIYYYSDEITFKDGRYQIYPTYIYRKITQREECLLSKGIYIIFKAFNLSLTRKIQLIYWKNKHKETESIIHKNHSEYLKEGNLNKDLRELLI